MDSASAARQQTSIYHIPQDLIGSILLKLSLESQLACAGVSSTFRTVALGSIAQNWADPDALFIAVKKGHYAAVTALLAQGANPNSPSKSGGHTYPLHAAASLGHSPIISSLLAHNAEHTAKDGDGNTAIIVAARKGHWAAVHILIKAGADTRARNNYGATALHKAAENNYLDVAAALIAGGADVNAVDSKRCTPLHTAAGQGFTQFVGLLLGHGAQVNVQNSFTSTPLHGAAQGGHVDICRQLINCGANMRAADSRGCRPMDLAFQYKRDAVVNLLKNTIGGVSVDRSVGVRNQKECLAFR